MHMLRFSLSVRLMICLPLTISCAPAVPRPLQEVGYQCSTASGELSDTLYAEQRVTEVSPPAPRPRHLAPYPPAGDGEYRIWFGGETYIAAGMPLRVTVSPVGDYKMVRIGSAGSIPVFAREEQRPDGERYRPRVWAPITDTCIFLPFNHESEIR